MTNRTIKRYKQEDREKIIASFKSSTASQKAWCEENKIPLSTMTTWLAAERKNIHNGNENKTTTWATVDIIETKENSSLGAKFGVIQMQIGKLNISIGNETDENLINNIIKTLVSIC